MSTDIAELTTPTETPARTKGLLLMNVLALSYFSLNSHMNFQHQSNPPRSLELMHLSVMTCPESTLWRWNKGLHHRVIPAQLGFSQVQS